MTQLMLTYRGKEQEGRSTDVEALAYLYTASLAIPLCSRRAATIARPACITTAPDITPPTSADSCKQTR